MAVADVSSLLRQAGCFACLSSQQRQLIRLGLLASWLPLPAKLAGTVAWYAPYRLASVTTDANGRVSPERDLSGRNNTLTIATPANGFLLQAPEASSNNLQYLGSRTAAAQAFATAGFGLVQPVTIYVLARLRTTQALARNLTDGTTSNNSIGILIQASTTTASLNTLVGFNIAIPGGLMAWTVYTAIFNGASSFFQLNRGTPVTGDAGVVNPDGFTLGSRADGNRAPDLDILEAIVRTGSDDAATRDSIQLYLAGKVGLSI